jgi:hypothetical protein
MVSSLDGNPAPPLSRFRVAYAYRLTPLLSIGASTNYSVSNPTSGYVWANELELNFYFINRKKFDLALVAGYGFRKWSYQNFRTEIERGQGFGSIIGLNSTFYIRNNFSMGLRLDAREVGQNDPDFGALLTFSKSF